MELLNPLDQADALELARALSEATEVATSLPSVDFYEKGVASAMIEAFLSPSSAPYWVKALVAVLSATLLMVYFVVLGYPRGD